MSEEKPSEWAMAKAGSMCSFTNNHPELSEWCLGTCKDIAIAFDAAYAKGREDAAVGCDERAARLDEASSEQFRKGDLQRCASLRGESLEAKACAAAIRALPLTREVT